MASEPTPFFPFVSFNFFFVQFFIYQVPCIQLSVLISFLYSRCRMGLELNYKPQKRSSIVLAMWISSGLLCQFEVPNLSVNRYVLESVLGYNFEHAFCWLFIIASTPYWRVAKRTKQLSTVEVAGLVRALSDIGSLTN